MGSLGRCCVAWGTPAWQASFFTAPGFVRWGVGAVPAPQPWAEGVGVWLLADAEGPALPREEIKVTSGAKADSCAGNTYKPV